MEEKELKQEEVQENTPVEDAEQENVAEENIEQQNLIEENQQEQEEIVSEKPKRDWSKCTLGAKSRDIALITFLGSTVLRSFSGYFASSMDSQKMFLKMYIYVPGILAVVGLIMGIIAVIKTKFKWNSVIGMLLNIFLIISAVLIYTQVKQAGY